MVAILNFRSAQKKTFVEVHPMIIHATNQLNRPRRALKLTQSEQLFALGGHVEFLIDTKNASFVEHPCQVSIKLNK